MIVGPVDAGDAEADRRRHDAAFADCLVHHVVQHLLDGELSDRLQIGAAGTRGRDHRPLRIREQAHGLGATGIESEDVNHGRCRHGSLRSARDEMLGAVVKV